MNVRELINKLEELNDDQESVYTMQEGVRVPPEIFVNRRLGVVIM